MTKTLAEDVRIRLHQQQTKPRRIVAVDGHSAAGKSTAAARLATELGAAIVHGDDFYRVMDDGTRVTDPVPGR